MDPEPGCPNYDIADAPSLELEEDRVGETLEFETSVSMSHLIETMCALLALQC